MKKNTKFELFLVLLIVFSLFSCAKSDDSSSGSSEAAKMSTPLFDDGNYKLTALTQSVYLSDGTLYGNYTYQINHDTSVSPGYFGYNAEWKGSGIYRVISKGKATISTSGLSDETIDCSTNQISDLTLSTEGSVISETLIQTGCGGTSSTLTTISEKFTSISGGLQYYIVLKDSSSNEYRQTYTTQKQ